MLPVSFVVRNAIISTFEVFEFRFNFNKSLITISPALSEGFYTLSDASFNTPEYKLLLAQIL
jgi:hypothetical protein